MILKAISSAVRGKDGQVDAGYLALFWTGAMTVNIIPAIMGYAMWMGARAGVEPEAAALLIDKAGTSCSLLAAAFATIVGAVGLFRAGDRKGDTPLPGPAA